MYVRQKIGREAGTIITMPFAVAESCLASGTVEKVTDEEIAAAGLEVEPVVVNRPDELPRGFRVEAIPGGFDLYDPGGVNISKEVDLPNMVAARDLAWSIMHPSDQPSDADESKPEVDAAALERLNKADLLKIAEDAHIDIASGAKKADIVAALIAAGITAPPEAEGAPGGAASTDEAGTEGQSTDGDGGDANASGDANGNQAE
jgi:hypothetical protein